MALALLRTLRLAAREAFAPHALARTPEPSQAMATHDEVSSFHEAGEHSLIPVYHFNALAVAALAPRGARVLDLGCGSGQFLSYLARRRPDLELIGLELSTEMIRVGQENLARNRLSERVRLEHGDMRRFARSLRGPVDVVTSIFSLHHLRTRADLLACLADIEELLRRCASNLWLFDFVRPRQLKTAHEVPLLFTPTASVAFHHASRDSLCAAWGYEEMKCALAASMPRRLEAERSRILPLYQAHWHQQRNAVPAESLWHPADDLPAQTRREVAIFPRLFRAGPHRSATGTPHGPRRGSRGEGHAAPPEVAPTRERAL